MTTACVLAFGGNSAASEQHFQRAIDQLANADTACHSFAKIIRSAPMGAAAGAEFVNSAGLFRTDLTPQQLLETIHQIESGFGRERSLRWGPRPIDIDVLFYGRQVIDTQTIVIPHPCLWYRSFVLLPLVEICPDWIHPIFQQSVKDLVQRLHERPLQITIQNESVDLPVLEIAKQCWQGNKHPLVAAGNQSDHKKSFCKIVVEGATQQVSNDKPRLQPRHESQRIIRCVLPPSNVEKSFRQFLIDFEAAVLG